MLHCFILEKKIKEKLQIIENSFWKIMTDYLEMLQSFFINGSEIERTHEILGVIDKHLTWKLCIDKVKVKVCVDALNKKALILLIH